MWLHFALLLLVGAAFAGKDHAWKTNHEYWYRIRSETLTGLDIKDQLRTGIIIEATLIIQSHSPELLRAAITAAHYSHVRNVSDDLNLQFYNREVDRKTVPLSGKPFEITIRHGLIRDLKTAKDIPAWEINFIKSIVSQLHLDTMGVNAKRDDNVQIPTNEQPYGMYATMEDSVGGKCEVLYDMVPLSDYEVEQKREMIPMPHLRGEDNFIEIRKVKNYNNCEEQAGYYFGRIRSPFRTDDKTITRSTTSRAIISGKLGGFTIHSSTMKSKIFVKPLYDRHQGGMIYSNIHLTLTKVHTEWKPLEVSDDLVSTKDLIFVYDRPFIDRENSKHRDMHISHQISENSKEENYMSSLNNHKNSEERHSRERHSRERHSRERHSRERYSRERDSNDSEDLEESRRYDITADQDLDTPIMPYLISYIENVKTNVVDLQKIVREIAADVENPEDVLQHKTLEKFSRLVSAIRSRTSKEIATIEKELQLSPNSLKDDTNAKKKLNVWKVFRDAVAQAGTGPALITIARWLREKKMVDLEAMMTVSRLSKSVGTITPQYLKAFFEIVKDPNTSEQISLYDVCLTVFGELIRDSKYRHNYLTRHIRGEKVQEDPAVSVTYIPYMSDELRKAVNEGNSARVMTYIRALGHTGHPKILSVFEPYLEGKLPMSKIQRATIIASMNNLIKTSPRIARSVLYKVYLNRQETYEVRNMAVLLLMNAHPSQTMLLRMAESTNYDTDRNVNSMIQSVIEAAIISDDEDLSRKALVASKLLNIQHYSDRYSKSRVRNVFASKNSIYKFVMNTISSDDIDIPKGVWTSWYRQFDGLRQPETKLGYLMSSVRQLLDYLYRKFDPKNKDRKGVKENLVDDIARALNIQSPDMQELEGHVYINSKYGLHLHSYDNHTLEKFVEYLKQYFIPWGKTQDMNLNQMNTYEVGISMATETGLPFFFTMKEPLLTRLEGRRNLNEYLPHGTNKAKLAIRFTSSMQLQETIGFMTPFEGWRYDVGLFTNMQFYLPVETELETNLETRTYLLKLRPFTDKDKTRLIHYDTLSFLWDGDMGDLRPRSSTKGYHPVRIEKRRKMFYEIGKVSIDVEFDSRDDRRTMDYNDYYWVMTKLWSRGLYLSKLDVYWTDKDRNDWTVVKILNHDVEINASHNDFSLPKMPVTLDMEANSKKRIERMSQELGKGFASGTAKIIDISVDIPYQRKGLLTMGMLNDEAEEKRYGLLYGNIRPVEDKEVPSEVYVSLQSQLKPILSGLDVEEVLRNPPKEEYKLAMAFGNVTKGQQIKMEGKQTQNDNLRNAIINSKLMMMCREEMKKGNKGLYACQKVNSMVNMRNQLELSMNIESQYVDMLVDILKSMSNKYMDTSYTLNTRNNEEQKIDMKLLLSPDFQTGDISLYTPLLNISLPYYSPSQYLTTLLGIPINKNTHNVLEKYWNVLEKYENSEQELHSCILDANTARTFDGNVYPSKLGQHWHVMVITVPQENPDTHEVWPIPSKIRVALLVREKNSNKEVKLIVVDKVIELTKTVDSTSTKLIINGVPLILVKNKLHREYTWNNLPIDIVELEDGSVKIVVDEEFKLVYDSQRVQIEMFPKFRKVISGLCGNYDMRPENDFLTPEKCVELNSEKFVASFAMIQDNNQEETWVNKYNIDRSNCIRMMDRQSNVVSDVEAGRKAEEGKQGGYHVDKYRPENKRCVTYHTNIVETHDQICFSVRPVPMCNEDCRSVEVKPKKYSFHCMPKTEASMQMKNRVEQGANPDLNRKTVHLSKIVDVPIACKAA